MSLAHDIGLAVALVALLELSYRMGKRHRAAEARARSFIDGWNAAVDTFVPDEDAWQRDAAKYPSFPIDAEHREAQLRNAQGGWQ